MYGYSLLLNFNVTDIVLSKAITNKIKSIILYFILMQG